MQIVPAILESNTPELIAQIKRAEELTPPVPHVHIDIMDGHFVETKNTIDPELMGRINSGMRFELHLMVKDPIAHMRAWREVENVFRVLFHHEAPGDPLHLINFARKEGWDVGVVINPETPLAETESYLSNIDVLQCMTVHPGRQGAPFVPEVLEKISAFSKLKERPLCSADGAVSKDTIVALKDAGAEIFNVGSALMKAEDIQAAYTELLELLNVKS